VGAIAGVCTWAVIVLTSSTTGGQLTAAVTNTSTYYLPYLAVAACATVVIGYATRIQGRSQ
jgi:hypothetical protein